MDIDALSDASSRLSSPASLSPSPPPDLLYPTPYSSQQSSSTESSPLPEDMSRQTSSAGDDEGPPKKKRRVTEPKERTTEYLDLSTDEFDLDHKAILARLLKCLHKKRKIVVIAGAGISVSAGIPDFRSSKGLFNSLRSQYKLKSSGKDLFDASVYSDDSSTSSFHDMVRSLSQLTKSAEPTLFHKMLARLAKEKRLLRLYTQNVDGIDIKSKSLATEVPLPKKGPWPKTIQLHGGLDHMVCTKCHKLSKFQPEKFEGPTPPPCGDCKNDELARELASKRGQGIGRLRPRMVLYNEHNPDGEAIGSVTASDLRRRPDAVIVVGTTLKVPGVRRIAREMCNIVRDSRDGLSIWINNDPVPIGKDLENCWDIVVKGPCDEVARQAALPDEDEPLDLTKVTDEEVKQKKDACEVSVEIPSPTKNRTLDRIQGMLTPVSSPRLKPMVLDEIALSTGKLSGQEQPSTPTKKSASANTKGGKKAPEKKKAAPKTTKPAVKRRPAATKKQAITNQKISNVLKVSKATSQTNQTKSKGQSKTRKESLPSLSQAPGPMVPLSPQAARNNTSPPYSEPVRPEKITISPQPHAIYRPDGTISPTARLPPNLAMLVD
ncbi:DHS-like NAD/FAD-binding domain-containing protein [Patellaria atrata CBS 101060]|uniref:DHS-like NAD/FAD-binding domain-containing protein n=1 Tax=Patellaria atrata CBS 101060 TaxID=1346257 RepID=A0A9P4SG20_9PEZI|nr:DHS-like NAD/FAD-binding domain-containing protein [Patellaria atrata CBS 101060]